MIKSGRSSGHKFVWEELDRCARSVVTVNSPSAAGWLSSEKVSTTLGSDVRIGGSQLEAENR